MSSPSSYRRVRPLLGSSSEGPASLDVGTLYSEHADLVARWAARLGGPGMDVEDIVHEVFLVACRRLGEFRGDAKVTTWLYEITVRIVQDRRRRQGRWRWFLGHRGVREQRGEGGGQEEAARIPGEQPSALELLERKEATTILYEILDGLSDKYRTAIILFELEGMSGQEIALVTKTSVANVWIRLFRGRQQFLKGLRAREAKERDT
jgi:RNA polymerase sigma-70 factor (ECF subfamily)